MKLNREALKKRILSRYKTLDEVFVIMQKRQEAVTGNKSLGLRVDLLVRDLENAQTFFAILTREQEIDITLLEKDGQLLC